MAACGVTDAFNHEDLTLLQQAMNVQHAIHPKDGRACLQCRSDGRVFTKKTMPPFVLNRAYSLAIAAPSSARDCAKAVLRDDDDEDKDIQVRICAEVLRGVGADRYRWRCSYRMLMTLDNDLELVSCKPPDLIDPLLNGSSTEVPLYCLTQYKLMRAESDGELETEGQRKLHFTGLVAYRIYSLCEEARTLPYPLTGTIAGTSTCKQFIKVAFTRNVSLNTEAQFLRVEGCDLQHKDPYVWETLFDPKYGERPSIEAFVGGTNRRLENGGAEASQGRGRGGVQHVFYNAHDL